MSQAWQCECSDHSLRFRRVNGGGIQYARQCHACGRAVGQAVKHSEVARLPPEWDYDLHDKWSAEQRELSAQQRVRGDGQSKAAYREYLQSTEWKERRRKVLERARWVCEGCRAERATEVHHLTYSHIFRELLYQLVALCDGCHAAAHGVEHQEQALNDA